MRFKWDKNESDTILNDPSISQGFLKDGQHIVINSEDEESFDESESSSLNFIGETTTKGATFSKWNIYQGILFSSLSSVLFSVCSVIVKFMKHIHPGELSLFRFIGIFLLSIPLVHFHGENYLGPPEVRHLLVLRGLAGSTSLFLRFCAFRNLPFVEASVIIFSVPVVVTIFACTFLQEPCGAFHTLVVTLTMIGLCLTVRLPWLLGEEGESFLQNWNDKSYPLNSTLTRDIFKTPSTFKLGQSLYLQGVLEALSSTLFAASVYILIRKAKKAHYSVIMFNFGLVAIFETSILTLLVGGFSMPSGWIDWSLIIALMLLSYLGQILLTKSLQVEQAAPVAIVRSATDIILAFIWQIGLFNQTPDAWSIGGALLVTLSIILTSLRKWAFSLPQHSSLRHKFHLIK